MDRRRFLQITSSTFGTISAFGSIAAQFWANAAFAHEEKGTAPAKSVVFVWLNGGPSHIDTFDPKPGVKEGGPFKAIHSRTSGMHLSEHLPLLAEASGSFTLIRSINSREGNHVRAQYLGHTGYAPNPTVLHPSLGSWLSQRLADASAELPLFVSVGGPSYGGGFLGVEHNPLVITKAGDLPENVALGLGVSRERFDHRLAALATLEDRFAKSLLDKKIDGRRSVYGKSVRMMLSPKREVFDLSAEPDATLKRYGDHDFGRGCLLARRLVEQGTRCVEVVLDGWDTHRDNFDKVKKLSHMLDGGLSGLLHDLEARNLLKSTLVVCLGDFGRTPAINGNDGRDHHPAASFALVAGGGLRAGLVVGETDDRGGKVTRDLIKLADLYATLAVQLGLDPSEMSMTPAGRPIAMTDNGEPMKALLVPSSPSAN